MKTIYALAGRDGVVRYVGCTSRSLAVRLREHLANARTRADSSPASIWIASCKVKPIAIIELEVVTDRKAADAEKKWIKHYRATVVNKSEGGKGFSGKMSESHRQAIIRGTTGVKHTMTKPRSPEHNAKIGAAVRAAAQRRRAANA